MMYDSAERVLTRCDRTIRRLRRQVFVLPGWASTALCARCSLAIGVVIVSNIRPLSTFAWKRPTCGQVAEVEPSTKHPPASAACSYRQIIIPLPVAPCLRLSPGLNRFAASTPMEKHPRAAFSPPKVATARFNSGEQLPLTSLSTDKYIYDKRLLELTPEEKSLLR